MFDNKPAKCLIQGKRISIAKLGLVRISLHRPLEETPATLKLKRENGKWYALVGCDGELELLAIERELSGEKTS